MNKATRERIEIKARRDSLEESIKKQRLENAKKLEAKKKETARESVIDRMEKKGYQWVEGEGFIIKEQ